jgi:glycosyltransferase involved in cell wall biosynthesis
MTLASPAPPAAAIFEKPVLSICITTYNRGAWLAHGLALVLEQTRPYSDLVEVVVCDNASTDETPAVAARFAHWPNLRIHRNEKNVGMLGNLAVSAAQARGRYVWVIGDDDLMVDGALERVLAAIALHPDVELVYTNYAFTRFDRPQDLVRVDEVIHGGIPISTERSDQHGPVSAISTRSPNCFTAIYCLVFREDHARAAYGQDTSGPPFSSLPTCVPTTHYVVEQMFDRPGYWVGDPCVVVNLNVSWTRYAALFILERFPEIFDRMEARGADPGSVDALRANHLRQVMDWLPEIYFGDHREHLPQFSIERLVRRFGRLHAFDGYWPRIEALYARAFRLGRVEDAALAPERLRVVARVARHDRSAER